MRGSSLFCARLWKNCQIILKNSALTQRGRLLAGFIGDLVAGFRIIVLQMAFQVTAHGPLGNGAVAVVLAPQLVDGIQIPGGDGAVGFQLDIPFGL